jgi:hypothetical protein
MNLVGFNARCTGNQANTRRVRFPISGGWNQGAPIWLPPPENSAETNGNREHGMRNHTT